MEQEQFDQLRRVFDALVELSPEAREAELERHALPPELRAHLDRLLQAHDATPPDELAAFTPEDLSGLQLGPWRLLRRIGAGGMGVVYLAERADGQFDRQVAVKLVQRGMASEPVLQRFASELRILAGLRHPNIASVLDAGLSPDGRPWFAMEHVDGIPIDEALAQPGADGAQCLQWLAAVARAVHAAHQRLVVHRDLKPANILIDGMGRPVLLDFGIAKLLDPGTQEELTQAGLRPLTPRYASPEQRAGGPVSTASDIYSLGLLVEGLCAADASVRGRADLPALVARARHEDPQQRYRSAEALADDLDRCRRGEPIAARPPSWRYRARRWASRHPLAARALPAGALLVVLLAGTALWQAHRVDLEQQRAQREAEKGAEVARLLVDLFASANPALQTAPAAEANATMLAEARRRIDALTDQPELQARAFEALAGIEHSHARYAEAAELAKQGLARLEQLEEVEPALSRKLRHQRARATARLDREEGAAQLEALQQELVAAGLADSPDRAIILAELSWLEPSTPRRQELVDEALRIHRASGAPPGRELGMAYNARGAERLAVHDYEAAIAAFEAALELDRAHGARLSPQRIAIVNNLASAHWQAGDDERADLYRREGLALTTELYGEESPARAGALEREGIHLATVGQLAEAEATLREAARLFATSHGPHHLRVFNAQRNVARVLMLQGRYTDADRWFADALDACRTERGDDASLTHYLRALRGVVAARAQDRPAAREGLLKAIAELAPRDNRSDSMTVAELRVYFALDSDAPVADRLAGLRACEQFRARTEPEGSPRLAEAVALRVALEEQAGRPVDSSTRQRGQAAWERYSAWGLADPVARQRLGEFYR